MLVGVPKEIKNHEYRVGLTPAAVKEFVSHGHSVLVETNAGDAIGFTNEMYVEAGAAIASTAEQVFAEAEMIVKVKEPQPNECKMLRKGQTLYTYLHLAPDPTQTKLLVESGATCIAYETVTADRGGLPLLAPMSEVAGRLVSQVSARLLTNIESGVGKLLSGVPGSGNCSAFIIGGGTVGLNAAMALMGAGADVTVADINLDRIREIDTFTGGQVKTIYPTPAVLAEIISHSEVVVGAVLVPGVIIDVAIDQGGCVDDIKPTSHQNPTYIQNDVIHYAVTNMPGIVGHTASISLSNATLPYVRSIASNGVQKAVTEDPSLAKGVNTLNGHITHPALAESLSMTYEDLEKMLS